MLEIGFAPILAGRNTALRNAAIADWSSCSHPGEVTTRIVSPTRQIAEILIRDTAENTNVRSVGGIQLATSDVRVLRTGEAIVGSPAPIDGFEGPERRFRFTGEARIGRRSGRYRDSGIYRADRSHFHV